MKSYSILLATAMLAVLASGAQGDTFLQGLGGSTGLQNEGSQGPSPRNDRFLGSNSFIGLPYNWSGVGLSSGGAWATMISSNYFLSANHDHPAPGSTVTFYTGNSLGGPSFTYTVDSFYYQTTYQSNGSDLCLQRFTTPVDASIAKYPVLSLPNDAAYQGVTNWTYGYPNRVGKNNIDSIQDLNLVPYGYGITRVMYYDYNATGGQGPDEAYVEPGDSGGPSFAVVNNSLALLGIHFVNDGPVHDGAPSGDSFVPFYVSQLNAHMTDRQQVATVAPIPATWKGPGGGSYNLASNWTNNIVPNGVNATANFLGNITAPSTVTMNSPMTVATLNFDSLQSYTISGSSSLILEAPSGTAHINVQSGSHEISVPVVMNDDTLISGAGALDFSGGISGNHALTVLGNLTATSIQVDSLTIGTPLAMAVPEPSTFVLLGIGAFGLLACVWRRR
jgi:hypothetical protein